ncbi:MAG: mechanosensitive ion channel domain-containing protein [Saprospiraceae bacterium]
MKEILNFDLFTISEQQITVSSLVFLALYSVVMYLILRLIKKMVYRVKKFDVAKQYTIYSLIKYIAVVLFIISGLQILGFNLSVLLAGSAAFLVGIGLGLQNLFSDFISGIIIMADATIKVGDILDINGLVCKVQEIHLRTTTVLTRDDKYIIIPNSDFTRNRLINWSHSLITSRFEVSVGVDYSSDPLLIMKILKQVAAEQSQINKDPLPFARFNDYEDSSMKFTLYFWCDDLFRVENLKSELRVRIYQLFKENNIIIPFPQRVLHIKQS